VLRGSIESPIAAMVHARFYLRRERAFPLIRSEPDRVSDHVFGGPDLPCDDQVRRRFFREISNIGSPWRPSIHDKRRYHCVNGRGCLRMIRIQALASSSVQVEPRSLNIR
jgi:hypothetical protein